jgi:hypothetical protein
MATSPNYGWSEPDNTSLVKDGAQAMRTLGDAIDTSVWNVGYGQAGKNKVINSDMTINQRNFTSTTTTAVQMVDRWRSTFTQASGVAPTYSVEQFTPGTAPVAGYEAKQYLRVVSTNQSAAGDRLLFTYNGIEDVRTFAGQTVTFSFWARAASGTPSVTMEFAQLFGTGGSPSTAITAIGVTKIQINTNWVRYTGTVAIPSISGKTVGTDPNTSQLGFSIWASAGSDWNTRSGSLGIQNNTFDIWGVQVEYGSKATPFQTASGGNYFTELAMCQRYYWRSTAASVYQSFGTGQAFSTTAAIINITNPVPMRTAPTSIDFSTLGATTALASVNAATATLNHPGVISSNVNISTTGLLAGDAVIMLANNSTSAYIAMNAEL